MTASSKNAFHELMNPTKELVPVDSDVICWAVSYRRTLRRPPDPNDVLIGTPYCGQAVRAVCKTYPTAQAVAEARWAEENSDSRRGDGGDTSFMEVLRMYGPDAFDNEVVELRRGPRSEMQTWANTTEKVAIEANGGTVRDLNPVAPIKQTFNTQLGGKGGNRFWYARDAFCKKRWDMFCASLLRHLQAVGHARPLRTYVDPTTGYNLGSAVHDVRMGMMLDGKLDEAERREWLESLSGWEWNAQDTRDFAAAGLKAKVTNALPETKAKRSKACKAAADRMTEDAKKKRIKNQKATNALPETFDRRSKAQKKRWDGDDNESRLQAIAVGQKRRRDAEREKALATAIPVAVRPLRSNRKQGEYYRLPDGSILSCVSKKKTLTFLCRDTNVAARAAATGSKDLILSDYKDGE